MLHEEVNGVCNMQHYFVEPSDESLLFPAVLCSSPEEAHEEVAEGIGE